MRMRLPIQSLNRVQFEQPRQPFSSRFNAQARSKDEGMKFHCDFREKASNLKKNISSFISNLLDTISHLDLHIALSLSLSLVTCHPRITLLTAAIVARAVETLTF